MRKRTTKSFLITLKGPILLRMQERKAGTKFEKRVRDEKTNEKVKQNSLIHSNYLRE